jgi:hypothetical protein
MSDLRELWRRSGERLNGRLSGLTDAEYFWSPVAGAWTVYEGASGWTYQYEFAPPAPAPFTTIAWRLVHIAADNWIYWDYAFGTAAKTFPELPVPATAESAVRAWRDSAEPISDWLDSATEADLDEPRPNHLGPDLPARQIVAVLLDEQTHHGAEIALLRDLYAHSAG